MSTTLSEEELARQVMANIRDEVRAGKRILLPARVDSNVPPVFVKNRYGGTLGDYRYQFEGEEDLLHLMVSRRDGTTLTAEDARTVASFLFEGVASALIWLKPGHLSQHFYVGHDDLLGIEPA